MADVTLIIHAGKEGLPEAVGYYATFPWEPSPAGEMDLQGVKPSALSDAHLEAVLDEMAGVKAGGVVMLVCHAYSEGLLMKLAKGAKAYAERSAIERLAEVEAAEARATKIRAMPSGTTAEQKARQTAWEKLFDDIAPGSVQGNFTDAQAQQFYDKWLDMVAQQQLGLQGAPPRDALRRLLGKIQKVRGLKLARVELRACNIGGSSTGMAAVKKLFGCQKLLAPDKGTFYLKDVPVNTMDQLAKLYVRSHPVRGASRTAGPAGSTKPVDPFIRLLRDPGSRLFWETTHTKAANPQPRAGVLDLGTTNFRAVFVLLVEEIVAFRYKARGAAKTPVGKSVPEWGNARAFVRQFIMPKAGYTQGALPIAGLWTPGGDDPFLLPAEAAYSEHIKQA